MPGPHHLPTASISAPARNSRSAVETLRAALNGGRAFGGLNRFGCSRKNSSMAAALSDSSARISRVLGCSDTVLTAFARLSFRRLGNRVRRRSKWKDEKVRQALTRIIPESCDTNDNRVLRHVRPERAVQP